MSQPGESRAAAAVGTVERIVDSCRQSCQTSSCEGLHGGWCIFRHTVPEEKEQDESETRLLSPGPSTKQIHPRSPTRDSWNNSWDRYDYCDKWTDVWKSGDDGNRWTRGWNEHYHGDNWTDAWRDRKPGNEHQHDDDNSTGAWNKCKSDDEWRVSHWETRGWCSSHWKTSGWNDTDGCCDDSQRTAVVK